ncbi:MAG: fluoride efflux transporter CrcB [Phycisphaerales bacterium]|nr:fluoride efflux transporter CrcB [Phycisphaerales bacterium]
MQKLILIAVAGAAGTLARYGLSGLVQTRTGASFPFGTLAVNLLGCFLFGLVFTLSERYTAISAETRVILLVGFAGAFTTFSTLMYESNALRLDGEWGLFIANILAQNLGGIVFIALGLYLGKLI